MMENKDICAVNQFGETALHLACRKGDADVVKQLLEEGADIDCRDCEDNTPLFHAVLSNNPHIVQVLTTAGCDLDTLNEELMTPLDQALLYNYIEIVTLLLKAGCEIKKSIGQVYFKDHYANSVISSLWKNGDLYNIQVLRDCGYKISYVDLASIFTDIFEDSSDHTRSEKGGGVSLLSDIMTQPATLKNCCRINIRHILRELRQKKLNKSLSNLIDDLDLPQQLKEYVKVERS